MDIRKDNLKDLALVKQAARIAITMSPELIVIHDEPFKNLDDGNHYFQKIDPIVRKRIS